MKKTCTTILILTFSIAIAQAGDPVAQQVSTQLNVQARQLVAMGVETEDAAKIQNSFQVQQMVQARNIVQAAKQQGLPVGPVVDKALEGIAKNVDARNIVRAMEQVRSRYSAAFNQSRQMTPEPNRQQAMTQTMAQAMVAGMSIGDMSAIAAQVQGRRSSMADEAYAQLAQHTFTTARDMARMGAKPTSVKDVLSLALQAQYTAKQMNQLRSQFMQQSRNSKTEVVVSRFQNQVRAGQVVGQQGAENQSRSRHGESGQGPGSGGPGGGGPGGGGPGGGGPGGGGPGGGGPGGGGPGGGGPGGGGPGGGGPGGGGS